MDKKRFEQLAEQAFDSLPKALLEFVDNVVFLVEDWPDPETLRELEIEHREDLLGLYQGNPLSERSVDLYGNLPDRVLLYQKPTERYARAYGERVFDVIRDTLIHEIGHHFGLDEEELAELEG